VTRIGSNLILPVAVAAVLATAAAAADTQVSLQRVTDLEGLYQPASSFDVTVTVGVSTTGNVTAIGLEETLPEGWFYTGNVSGTQPLVSPEAGTVGNDGLLEFAWIPVPDLPFTFTYRVTPPADAAGTRQLRGQVLARVLEEGADESEEFLSPLVVTVLPGQGDTGLHSADANGDNIISLSELLRVIQFFNLGGYHCAPDGVNTEDGYQPGFVGPRGCDPHSSDYNPQNWIISLSELLRLIQFFNSGGYNACPETNSEDGFCTGLPNFR